MSGASPLTMEQMVNDSEPMDGVVVELDLPPLSWRNNDGSALAATGAGVIGYGAILTNLVGLVANATADQTDIIRRSVCLPGNLCFLDPGVEDARPNMFELHVFARKLDTTGAAAENADLALKSNIFWQIDGETTAVNTLAADVSKVLSAKAVAASEEAFAWYVFDYAAAMTATQKRNLKKATTLTLGPMDIILFPHEAVGANLAIEISAIKLRYRAHLGLRTRSERY